MLGELHTKWPKRGYWGTYRRMSPKHLPRYLVEVAGRHDDQPEAIDQMPHIPQGTTAKRL